MNHAAAMNGWMPFVNMQCQYNLLYREEEREMLPYCRDQDILRAAAESIGLDISIDAIGNMTMTVRGRDRVAKCIVMGSHLDSVSQGLTDFPF